MARRNRVDPLGHIVDLDFRGTLMGNRGILHADDGRIVRDQASRAWITCALSFRGRHRELLQPGRWTELFFWDEATALAAGHRPCFECRRESATRFRDLFRHVTGQPDAVAPDIDVRLSAERRRSRYRQGSGRILVLSEPAGLPPGTMLWHRDQPHLVVVDGLRPWDRHGYGPTVQRPDHEVAVITPTTTVAILAAGYEPATA